MEYIDFVNDLFQSDFFLIPLSIYVYETENYQAGEDPKVCQKKKQLSKKLSRLRGSDILSDNNVVDKVKFNEADRFAGIIKKDEHKSRVLEFKN